MGQCAGDFYIGQLERTVYDPAGLAKFDEMVQRGGVGGGLREREGEDLQSEGIEALTGSAQHGVGQPLGHTV